MRACCQQADLRRNRADRLEVQGCVQIGTNETVLPLCVMPIVMCTIQICSLIFFFVECFPVKLLSSMPENALGIFSSMPRRTFLSGLVTTQCDFAPRQCVNILAHKVQLSRDKFGGSSVVKMCWQAMANTLIK